MLHMMMKTVVKKNCVRCKPKKIVCDDFHEMTLGDVRAIARCREGTSKRTEKQMACRAERRGLQMREARQFEAI